jgi:hypothetical protein
VKHLLIASAIATSILAVLGVTPLTVVSTDAVQRLAIGASVVLWFAVIADHAATGARERWHQTNADLGRVADLTEASSIMRAVAGGQPLTLPQPHGAVTPVAIDLNGVPAVVGVDEDAELAPVVDIASAIRGRGGNR